MLDAMVMYMFYHVHYDKTTAHRSENGLKKVSIMGEYA